MSFQWSEYLTLARELIGQAGSPAGQEARRRAAVSRAYYAAFCESRNDLREREGHRIPVGGRAHQYVRDEFKKSADRRRKQVGYDLDRLRSDRNTADYNDHVAGLDAMTKADLALAGKVISILSGL